MAQHFKASLLKIFVIGIDILLQVLALQVLLGLVTIVTWSIITH